MTLVLSGLVVLGMIKVAKVCINEIKENKVIKRNETRKFNSINY